MGFVGTTETFSGVLTVWSLPTMKRGRESATDSESQLESGTESDTDSACTDTSEAAYLFGGRSQRDKRQLEWARRFDRPVYACDVGDRVDGAMKREASFRTSDCGGGSLLAVATGSSVALLNGVTGVVHQFLVTEVTYLQVLLDAALALTMQQPQNGGRHV